MAAITNNATDVTRSPSTGRSRRAARSRLKSGGRGRKRRSLNAGLGIPANDAHDAPYLANDREVTRDDWHSPRSLFDSVDDGTAKDESRRGANKERSVARGDSDKASFLTRYFRDMSAMEVLRPEEELVAARQIEALELALCQQIFLYPPIVNHIVLVIEKSMSKSVDEFRELTRVSDKARKSNTKASRHRLAEIAKVSAARLHALDVDRIFMDAVLAEIGRIERGEPSEFTRGKPRFSSKSRLFRAYVARVRMAEKAAEEARNDFVRANLRLVVSIARRFNHGRMALADLIQEGNIGLMKAVQRYDYRRGFRFSTYASWWIRHAVSRALADKGREVRLPVHMIDAHHKLSKAKRELTSKLGRKPTSEELADASHIPAEKIDKMRSYLIDQSFSLDRPVNDEDGRTFLEFLRDPNFEDDSLTNTLHQEALARAVRHALHDLKPIEADILRKRFGLDNDQEHTLKQIGEKYNLSRERIRQLQEQALSKVRLLMEHRRLRM